MGPALHVTHLLAFTVTPVAPSLRLIKLSDGPTFSFRVERYSLMKDVLSASRRARSIGAEYLTPPLVCPSKKIKYNGTDLFSSSYWLPSQLLVQQPRHIFPFS